MIINKPEQPRCYVIVQTVKRPRKSRNITAPFSAEETYRIVTEALQAAAEFKAKK